MTEPVTTLFTFGYSQQCPYTGKELGDHYALVTAPDRSSARTFMNTAFKRNWAFEYDGPGDTRIADYVPRMTLHMTVNLLPEQPMPADPTGLGYSRADDGETTQPIVGRRREPHFEDGRAVIEVADGRVVHECCGKLDDAPHANFCAGYRPGVVEVAGGLVEVDPPEGFVPAAAPQVCLGTDMNCGRPLPCPDHPKCSPECDAMTTRPEVTGMARGWHHDDCPVAALAEADHELRDEWTAMVNAEREDDR